MPKFYGRHIEQHREHLRGLIEADDQRGLIEKTDQPPQSPEPEKGEKNGLPEPPQADDNPHRLKVIDEVPLPKPECKSKKRNAG